MPHVRSGLGLGYHFKDGSSLQIMKKIYLNEYLIKTTLHRNQFTRPSKIKLSVNRTSFKASFDP